MLAGHNTSNAQDKFALFNCRRLPGRLNTTEPALLLGFQEHDIAPLISAKLLVPLGRPSQNSPKYFAAVDVLARAENPQWLSQATKVIGKHWRIKNEGKRNVARFTEQLISAS